MRIVVRNLSWRSALLAAAAGLSFSVTLAGTEGDWMGRMPITPIHSPGSPLEILVGDWESRVIDHEKRGTGGRVALAEKGGHDAHTGKLFYLAEYKNVSAKALDAVEFRWEALNAFDEKLGEWTVAYRLKKPLKPGKDRNDGSWADRISSDATSYRLSVVRVRFTDGSIWEAAEETPADEPTDEINPVEGSSQEE